MASINDVTSALAGLKSDFDTLTSQAKALYDQLKAIPVGSISPADLDPVLATINADRAAVQAALVTITTPPVAG